MITPIPYSYLGLLLIALSLLGCSSAKEFSATRSAALAFPCDREQLDTEQISVDTFRVVGCGKIATYMAVGECTTQANCHMTQMSLADSPHGQHGAARPGNFIKINKMKAAQQQWFFDTGCPKEHSHYHVMPKLEQVAVNGCGFYGIYLFSGSCTTGAKCTASLSSSSLRPEQELLSIKSYRVYQYVTRELFCKTGRVTPIRAEDLPHDTAGRILERARMEQEERRGTLRRQREVSHFRFTGCDLEAYYRVDGGCYRRGPCDISLNESVIANQAAFARIKLNAVKKAAWQALIKLDPHCSYDSILATANDWTHLEASGCDYQLRYKVPEQCSSLDTCTVTQITEPHFTGDITSIQDDVVRATATYDLACDADNLELKKISADLFQVHGCNLHVRYKVSGNCHKIDSCNATIADEQWERLGVDHKRILNAVVTRAEFDFGCHSKTTVTPLLQSSFLATGCGKKAIYELQGRCTSLNNCKVVRSADNLTPSAPSQSILLEAVRRQAMFDFQCDGANLEISALGSNSFGVEGCNKRGNYATFGRCDTLANCSARLITESLH